MKLTTAQLIVRYLIKEKIPYVLGIFGHGNIQLAEALKEQEKSIRFIQVKNEQNGVHIAIAYAKVTGRPLAVTSSIGPGTTNMVTGAAAAFINRLPVLLLPGDAYAERIGPLLQQIEGRNTSEEMASDSLKPVSRYWFRVNRPEQLRQELPKAFEAMLKPGEQGPATICLPMDIQAESYDFDIDIILKERDRDWERISPDSRAIERAVQAIKKAKRPIIIAGGGVIYSQAWEELIKLAEHIVSPVIQTHAGNGTMLFSHPLNIYTVGPDGTLCGNNIAEKSDLIIGVGTRYTDFTTRSKTLFGRNAQFININTSPFDLVKERAIKLWGDAKITLELLYKKLKNEKFYRNEYYKEIQNERKKWINILEKITHEDTYPMTQARVIGVLNDFKKDDAVVVSAAGSLPGHLLRFWKNTDPTRKSYHVEYGYSTMGYEIPGAIGVKLAEPHRDVYALIGDASFLMQPQEIVTAVQEKIPITILVIDNGGAQVIRNLQKISGLSEFGNEFKFRDKKGKLNGKYLTIDFVKIAEGMGAKGFFVDTPEKLKIALGRARKIKDKPTLIHIKTEPGRKFPPGYNSWWDVPIPEVSKRKAVKESFRKYQIIKKKQVVR
ncbi:3D-(3,5/4)-trihydroxycyclohexane-1,2-dione acylhydrolase (decyclizing) [bacterium]|nr:3D-(3,5/4)-trihydroxycyclohexane-1,2-dione acylhydrolase (decyclizing) [bacterium]